MLASTKPRTVLKRGRMGALYLRTASVTASHNTTHHHEPSPSAKQINDEQVLVTHHYAEPTREQLRAHFFQKAAPMVGFGIMDQTIMLHAADAIDCSLGVALGLSTLHAAAFGQIVSNACSVVFGGAVERAAAAMGLPSPHFMPGQRKLPIVQRTGLVGTLVGVTVGCIIGLLNLLFIDTERAVELKTIASLEEHPYEIEVSNTQQDNATVITVRGPDRDGLLACIANAFIDSGLSLVDVNAHSKLDSGLVEDVFVVQSNKKQISDKALREVAKSLQEATECKRKISVQRRMSE